MPTTSIFRFFEDLVDPFDPAFDDTADADNVTSYVKGQIRPFKRLLPVMAAVGFLKAALECWIVFYAGHLIDLMIATGPSNFWEVHKLQLTLMVLLVLFARPVIIMLDHLFLDQTVGSNLQEQVRWRSHRKVLGQPFSFFQTEFAGRLTNRIMQMGQAVEEGFHAAFEAIWFAFAYAVSAVIVLSNSDIRLGIPLLVWIAVYAIYVRSVTRKVLEASEKWSNARSSMSGRVVDAYSNIETIKTHGCNSHEQRYALDGLRELRQSAMGFRRLMTELALGTNFLNGVMIVAVMVPAVWLWTVGHVSPGDVAAAATLTIRLNGMTGWILFVTTRLFEHAGIIRDGLSSIRTINRVRETEGARTLDVTYGAVQFEDVVFGYDGSPHSLSIPRLEIPGGQKLGIVGSSGAGKSTLVRLLTRLDDPQIGRILIDGQDIRRTTQDSLRKAVAIVSQDTSLLHRSIRENLTYGCKPKTDAEIIAAARRASAHEFILGLSDADGRTGYDAVVGERGVSLSGGQRQRLSIARAILRDAPILVLDEATSALDSTIEKSVLAELESFLRPRTVIAIAHRLSTLVGMDRIIFLEHGRIVEDGAHATLLSRDESSYRQLWEDQMVFGR